MAMAANDIERLIRARIPDAEVTIRDLAGDGDHYAATVIADSCRGKSRIQQHQIVYEALKSRNGRQAACAGVADRYAGALKGRRRRPFSAALRTWKTMLHDDGPAAFHLQRGLPAEICPPGMKSRHGLCTVLRVLFALHIFRASKGESRAAGVAGGARKDDRDVNRAIHRQ